MGALNVIPSHLSRDKQHFSQCVVSLMLLTPERDMGEGGSEHRNTAKKFNEHSITARKMDETPSLHQ